MRLKWTVSVVLACAMVALIVSIATVAFGAAPGWAVRQLTPDDPYDIYSHSYPRVYGDRVVWTGLYGGHSQVFTEEVGPDASPVRLTDDALDVIGFELQVSGDRVVWRHDGSHDQICTWRAGDSSVTTLTSDMYDNYGPQVSGDRVVWVGDDGWNYHQIFTWRAGDSSVTTLTTDGNTHEDPQVSGDRVVWAGDDGKHYQIFTMKIGVDASPVQLTTDANGHDMPLVSGDRVVWLAYDGSHDQICTWRPGDSSVTTLTSDMYSHEDPQVSGDRVVWRGFDGAHYQIFTLKIGVDASPVQLTTGGNYDDVPQVSGDRVVWRGSDGAHNQIFMQRIGVDASPVQLTTDANDHNLPQISGDRVVWVGDDRGNYSDYQIFTATPTKTSLTHPTLSPRKPTHASTKVTFRADLEPYSATAWGRTTLCLWHYETKTVRRWIHLKWRSVRVHYWRPRLTLTMGPVSSGGSDLAVKAKLRYAGHWKAQASYSGWQGYRPAVSATRLFTVK